MVTRQLTVALLSLTGLLGFVSGTSAAAENVAVEEVKNVEYVAGGGIPQSLDLYLPKTDKPLPVIVYIHGGGWEGGNKDGCWAVAETQRGYAAVSLNYRLSGQAKFPAQIQDCQAAIRFLRANAKKYQLDPDRIGVWGDSAGGHLVALLGTSGGKHAFVTIGGNEQESDKVQAVCDWYGPTDFLTFAAQAGPDDQVHSNAPQSPISRLFGAPVPQVHDLALSASPVHFVDKDCPPFLIEHVMGDPIVPLAQSRELADALNNVNVSVTLLELPGHEHGGGMINHPGWLRNVEFFFDTHLK